MPSTTGAAVGGSQPRFLVIAVLEAVGRVVATKSQLAGVAAAAAAGSAATAALAARLFAVRRGRLRNAALDAAAKRAASAARLRQSASTASFSAAKEVARQLATNPDEEFGPLRVDRKSMKVGVDRQFYKQFRYILAIAVPSIRHRTVVILVLHTAFLVLRTYLSVLVARIDGMIARDL
ncbi:hypothetical protein HK405_004187, partial [Cladochytrium tenue]